MQYVQKSHYFQKSEDINARIFADGPAEFPVSAFNPLLLTLQRIRNSSPPSSSDLNTELLYFRKFHYLRNCCNKNRVM